MRREKKTKTGCFNFSTPVQLIAKRKHRSMVVNPDQPGRIVAAELIQSLLQKWYEDQLQKDNYSSFVATFMQQIEVPGSNYFTLEMTQPEEIYNFCDEEPPSQQERVIEVVPQGYIKQLVTVPAGEKPDPKVLELEALNVWKQKEKIQKEVVMQKMKKQYFSTIRSTYMSQSMPIFEEQEVRSTEMYTIEQMRRNLEKKQLLPKKSANKIKMWFDQGTGKRRENKLNTIFRRSKAFMEQIDPTNSIYDKSEYSKEDSNLRERRSLILPEHYSFHYQSQEETVSARATNLCEISNLVPSQNDKIQPIGRRESIDVVKLPRLSDVRAQFTKKIDFSFHNNPQTTLRRLNDSQRQKGLKVRHKNSISVGELPKIKRVQ